MPDGRFHLLDTPLLPPGTCYITGATGPVVDTGYTIQWFPANAPRQRLYLSVDVVREMAEVAGVRTVKSTNEVMHDVAEYNRGYMDAVKERVGDQLVDLVDRLGLLSHLLGGNVLPDPVDPEGPGDGAGAAGERITEARGADDGDGGSVSRPRRGVRRADVPGNPAA